jgi:hypothetical protein
MDDNRKKALSAALGQIEKQFGKGSVMRLGDASAAMYDIEAVSTGSLGLDVALGIGGLPRGRVVEIYGPESSGKTTLTLEVIAEIDGVTIISDYGHHPSEIRATLQAVRTGWGSELRKFRVIFQPHRYSRTRDCFAEFLDAFSDCDDLLMTDIYAASEEPIEGITAARLCEAISRPVCRHVAELDAIPEILAHEMQPGDVVLCLGAGSIGAFAERLPALLAQTNPRLSAAV